MERITITDTFRVFAVASELLDTGRYRVIAPLRETGWKVDIDSGDPTKPIQAIPNADAAGGGSPPSHAPSLDTSFFNTELNNSANDVPPRRRQEAPSGSKREAAKLCDALRPVCLSC